MSGFGYFEISITTAPIRLESNVPEMIEWAVSEVEAVYSGCRVGRGDYWGHTEKDPQLDVKHLKHAWIDHLSDHDREAALMLAEKLIEREGWEVTDFNPPLHYVFKTRQRYEHKVLESLSTRFDAMEKELNEFGQKGWKVVGVVQEEARRSPIYILERPTDKS